MITKEEVFLQLLANNSVHLNYGTECPLVRKPDQIVYVTTLCNDLKVLHDLGLFRIFILTPNKHMFQIISDVDILFEVNGRVSEITRNLEWTIDSPLWIPIVRQVFKL